VVLVCVQEPAYGQIGAIQPVEPNSCCQTLKVQNQRDKEPQRKDKTGREPDWGGMAGRYAAAHHFDATSYVRKLG